MAPLLLMQQYEPTSVEVIALGLGVGLRARVRVRVTVRLAAVRAYERIAGDRLPG
jgi:hypothetical protein